MKVILLKDIPKVGKKFEIKDLAEGHVQNFLIPRGLVQIATAQAVQKITLEKDRVVGEKKIQEELFLKSLDTLKNTKIVIQGKANEKGHLFAGINKETLISEIFKQSHFNLDPETIVLEKPLKEIGEHKITVQAFGKKTEISVLIENK